MKRKKFNFIKLSPRYTDLLDQSKRTTQHPQPKLVPERRMEVKPGFTLMPVKKGDRTVNIQVPRTLIGNSEALKTYLDAKLKEL